MSEAATAAQAHPPPHAGEWWRASAAWSLLDEAARDDLSVLLRFVAAARTVADHPALAPERKERALAALAAPLGGPPLPAGDDAFAATWAAPAQALAALLAARGIDARGAWQVLQAAGQDLRKTRYRDWSDLLTWCRFAAAPVGHTALALLGGDGGDKRAQSLAIAAQLAVIVAQAGGHYRWLGRVYLPERWFAEAQGDIADLGFQRPSPALSTVTARALEQAAVLADEAKDIGRGLPTWRRRAATRAVTLEIAAAIGALASGKSLDAILRAPSPSIRVRAVLWALFARQ